MRIDIKPLSVNDCWKGKRYKTMEYKLYEQELYYSLKQRKYPTDKKLKLIVKVGITHRSDIDNVLKPFIDILQKRYGINDKFIYKIVIEKENVKQGNEYIDFEIYEY